MVLQGTKRLNNDQYDRAVRQAQERIVERVGSKPTREQFDVELDKVWSREDIPVIILFVVSFILSAVHVFGTVGQLALQTYTSVEHVGLYLSQQQYVVVHQVGFAVAAEFALLSFMILLGLKPRLTRVDPTQEAGSSTILQRVLQRDPRLQVRDELGMFRRIVFYTLMGSSILFSVYANLESGLPFFIALMIPSLTVGVGFYLERKIVDVTRKRRLITKAYNDAILSYKKSTLDPTQHEDYRTVLYNEILQVLMGLKPNREWATQFEGDVPPHVKRLIVEREITERENWMDVAIPEDLKIEERAEEESYIIKDVSLISNSDNVTENLILPTRTRIAEHGRTREMTEAEIVADTILLNNWYNGKKFAKTYQDMTRLLGKSNSTISEARKLVEGGHRL